ncbi:MAG: response regulator transcription factor [Bacteroidales bacterium]|nr:response regulator transcription factor [Bacteroidales bacterium]
MKINKIVIAEPSPIVAAGLLKFFEELNQIHVVSVVDNLDDLNDKMIIHNPDMLIVNPLMMGYTNNNLIKQITQAYPETICIALVTTFIDKNFLRYFREVIELSDNKQKVANKIFNLINNNDDSSSQNESVDLSNRETDVLICVAKGMTNKDISDMLNISVHTVITHRKNIVKKTGIKSVSGLTVYALLNNLVEESEIYE